MSKLQRTFEQAWDQLHAAKDDGDIDTLYRILISALAYLRSDQIESLLETLKAIRIAKGAD